MRFSVLIFGLIGAISSAQTPNSVFDVGGELKLADWRVEMANHPPAADQASVAQQLQELSDQWKKQGADCRDPRSMPGLTATKSYLEKILLRLARASDIEDRLRSEYGVCLQADPASNGWFAFLANSPRLDHGIIHMPVPFLQQASSEDELAFVIAHEFSHYLLHAEILQAYAAGTHRASGELLNALETTNEREADELAIKLVVNAGYDLDSALTLTAKLRTQQGGVHLLGGQLFHLRDLLLLGLPAEAQTKLSSHPFPIPKIVSSEWTPRA